MSRVLIVGSTSDIGRFVGNKLSSSHEVFYAGRAEANFYLDLSTPDLDVFAGHTFDIIIHMASHFGGTDDDSIRQAETVNVLGSLAVCELASRAKAAHLIFISSISSQYDENHPYFGIYALSKRHSEEMARFYCGTKAVPLTVLRPAQVYDAQSKCRKHQGLIYSMIDKAQQGGDIEIYGTNDASRSLIYLGDFAEVIKRVINSEVFGVFNCTSVVPTRLSEIANTAYNVFGKGGAMWYSECRPDIPDIPHFDSEPLYRKIDYYPETDLYEGIRSIKLFRESI